LSKIGRWPQVRLQGRVRLLQRSVRARTASLTKIVDQMDQVEAQDARGENVTAKQNFTVAPEELAVNHKPYILPEEL